ncbi:hypothetical protein AB0K21_42365 [Streptosporangium sp. NPDC049248]|uniref:hypothetical protein n=1 Tax=Streptosporangium sp. NPDC049248 TaxID=3155651 RepID=UPI003413083C
MPLHDFDPPGAVAHDDPELSAAMAVVDGLRPSEQRMLICNAVRGALATQRTGEAEHATRFMRDLLATVHLRAIPAYVQALSRERKRPARGSGPALRVEDVLRKLQDSRPGA